MQPSERYTAFARIDFDPRQERLIASMARWAGLLGRFQVLAGSLVFLLVVGVAVAYGTTEAIDDPTASETTPPIVILGDITPQTLMSLGIVSLIIGAILVRGGILLNDAADELDRVAHTDEADLQHLETALASLRSYFRMEAVITACFLFGACAWAFARLR